MAENQSSSSSGYSLIGVIGMAWAAVLSWSIVPSVGWTVLHGLFGWLYLILHALGCHA